MNHNGLPAGSYRLADGQMFNLLEPDPRLITLDAVALGLSKTCRFAGQVPGDRFYSVAEHSVYVSQRVPKHLALHALLHDASEGMGMGDMVSPLKALLPEYRVIEKKVMRAVALAFGISVDGFGDPAIEEADRRMLSTEQIVVRGRPGGYPTYAPYTDLRIPCLEHKAARELFLDRYIEITDDRGHQWSRGADGQRCCMDCSSAWPGLPNADCPGPGHGRAP